ncbi:cell division GTPase FtsZ [Halohasta litchfieldiae]|jgi:cell division GTPase FtsZ|uniref:Tubulin-like protein CetZ n=1 Tax=Halohasta litchfieldiae TaxID=1073996 RepID=A0A1H6SIT1_9EURY|nr:tubulin/FtsZ family protein [Halohasta litchfieldiae]ATW87835.1 cell division GTPase FtsZ [Halohasta litchfieldiae]SEI63940.1 Cell division GTPase FtsZ [Halohasta litchfieldiae]
MQLIVCGLGGAGSRLAEGLVAANSRGQRSAVVDSVALDTDEGSLGELEEISDDHRHLYGVLESSGRGLDGHRKRGQEVAEEELTELFRAVDDLQTSRGDAFLLCAGLAGATGATLLPHLAAKLRSVYEIPIYGLGVLPDVDATADEDGSDETGKQVDRAANAGLAIDTVTETTDSLLLFDNALWTKTAETDAEPAVRTRLNETLVTRVTALFEAGEIDRSGRVAESVVDASEVINTLSSGGIVSLGHASQEVDRPTESRFGLGLFMQDKELDETTAIKAIETTVRRAVNGKLTVDINRGSVQRGLLVTGGPPEWLNRQAIADARSWLAQETGSVEIRGGDIPTPDTDTIVALVVLAGVGDCQRVSELRAAAANNTE